MNENTIFYFPWKKSLSFFIAALTLVPFVLILSLPEDLQVGTEIQSIAYIAAIFSIIAPQIGIWFFGDMSISDEGIVLYKVNKLTWQEIVAARKSKSFGISSIYIKRKKGLPWSLPLYMVGEKSIKEALLLHVPKNNILYKAANEL